jgi:uncharacterized damage-inducible protein DinB
VSAAAVALGRQLDEPLGVYAPLVRLLEELASMLMQVRPSVYTARPFLGMSGSIGEHVRHVLDHVAPLATAAPHDILTYDERVRGTSVEADSTAALATIVRMKALLTTADSAHFDQPITVTAILSRGREPVAMRSTLRRELAFVISHTVHHQALIAMLLAAAGHAAPQTFGLAPSTPTLGRS